MRLDDKLLGEMDKKIKEHEAERKIHNTKETVIRTDLISSELLGDRPGTKDK